MTDLIARITDYLGNGGFFNPEAMEHDKVRDLLVDCLDSIRELEGSDALADRIVAKLRGDNHGLTPSWLVDMGGENHHTELGKRLAAAEAKIDTAAEAKIDRVLEIPTYTSLEAYLANALLTIDDERWVKESELKAALQGRASPDTPVISGDTPLGRSNKRSKTMSDLRLRDTKLHIGGALRCCISSVSDIGAGAAVHEGQLIPCAHVKDQEGHGMVLHNGIWTAQWLDRQGQNDEQA